MREKRKLKQRNQTRLLNLKVQRTSPIYACLEREVSLKTLVGSDHSCCVARLKVLPTRLAASRTHVVMLVFARLLTIQSKADDVRSERSVFFKIPNTFQSVCKDAHMYTHGYTCTYVCTQEHTCLWLSAYRDIYRQLQMAQSPILYSAQTHG